MKIENIAVAIAITAIIIAAAGLALPGTPGQAGETGSQGAAGPAGAQGPSSGIIQGTVVDVTGKPIAKATVITEPATATATTDSAGAFKISDVPVGTYGVTALGTGYSSSSEIIRVIPTTPSILQLSLSKTTLQLIKIRGVMAVDNEIYPDKQVAITLKNGYGYSDNNKIITSGLPSVGVGNYIYFEGLSKTLTGEKITSWSWKVTPPITSTAKIENNQTQYPRLKTDAIGRYVVTVTVKTEKGTELTSSREVYAGRWAGAQTCASCHSGSVMPDKVSSWAQTGHATKFEAFYGSYAVGRDYCARCHTVGYDETADNGGFDDAMRTIGWTPEQSSAIQWLKGNPVKNTTIRELVTNPNIYKVMNIQCENCHGPGGNTHTKTFSFEGTVCGQCHGQIKELRQSLHGTGEHVGSNYPSTAGNAECAACHTGQGFVNSQIRGLELIYPDKQTATKKANMEPVELQAPIACATCHDSHEATHPEKGNYGLKSKQLRVYGEVETPQGFTVEAGESAICVKCHANKRDTQYLKDFLAGKKTRGAHGNTQADVLYGNGVITFGANFTNSPHTTVVAEGCIECHMFSAARAGTNVAGAHTWNMEMKNGTQNIGACTQSGCHAKGSITTFDRTASADFDGDGTIEGVQTEVQGLLDKLATKLPKDKSGAVMSVGFNATNTSELQRKALWNYWVVNNDGSKGVHNTQFSVQVLQETYKQLTGETAGAKASPAPKIPHSLDGRSECTLCHSVGGSGVGQPGGMGTPSSHQGRTSDTCRSCHQSA